MEKLRVIAYIDGFNLFYSSLKGTPYKWLNIYSLCQSLLKPNQELVVVKYFSARISAFVNQNDKPEKQKIYLQALATIPGIEMMFGYFSIHKVKMPAAKAYDQGKIVPVEVIKTEEKGTDVNLAVQMVSDAYEGKFDYAMLFSNDSDMAYSVKISANICKKRIGLYIDKKSFPAKVLQENVCYIKRLTPAVFAAHQLPETLLSQTNRLITKPSDW